MWSLPIRSVFKVDFVKTYLFCPQRPVVVDEVQHGERHGEQAEEEVRHCHVGDENVAGCL